MAATIAEVAGAIAASLAAGNVASGEAEARRLAFSFVEQLERTPLDTVRGLVREAPAPVGDQRFDALLAAVVEHGCSRRGLPSPTWVDEGERFLSTWWFVSGLASLHADALVHSPISFARRGVFVTDGALTYA